MALNYMFSHPLNTVFTPFYSRMDFEMIMIRTSVQPRQFSHPHPPESQEIFLAFSFL